LTLLRPKDQNVNSKDAKVLLAEATTTSSNPADSVAISKLPRSMAVHIERDDGAHDDLYGVVSHSDEMTMTTKPKTTKKKCKKGSPSISAEVRMDEAAVKVTQSYRAWLELQLVCQKLALATTMTSHLLGQN
jgi:hypothetical protein